LREPSGRGGLADGGDAAVGHAEDDHGWRGECGEKEGIRPGPEWRRGFTGAGCEFCGYAIDPAAGRYGCANSEGDGLADASSEGSQIPKWGKSFRSVERGETSGPIIELCLPLFPPGPGDAAAWQRILAEFPDLAPAIEFELCGLADVAAPRVDRLRAGGNGVVVLQGAYAFRVLAERARLKF
jgi:hypothetical protein